MSSSEDEKESVGVLTKVGNFFTVGGKEREDTMISMTGAAKATRDLMVDLRRSLKNDFIGSLETDVLNITVFSPSTPQKKRPVSAKQKITTKDEIAKNINEQSLNFEHIEGDSTFFTVFFENRLGAHTYLSYAKKAGLYRKIELETHRRNSAIIVRKSWSEDDKNRINQNLSLLDGVVLHSGVAIQKPFYLIPPDDKVVEFKNTYKCLQAVKEYTEQAYKDETHDFWLLGRPFFIIEVTGFMHSLSMKSKDSFLNLPENVKEHARTMLQEIKKALVEGAIEMGPLISAGMVTTAQEVHEHLGPILKQEMSDQVKEAGKYFKDELKKEVEISSDQLLMKVDNMIKSNAHLGKEWFKTLCRECITELSGITPDTEERLGAVTERLLTERLGAVRDSLGAVTDSHARIVGQEMGSSIDSAATKIAIAMVVALLGWGYFSSNKQRNRTHKSNYKSRKVRTSRKRTRKKR